MNASTPLVLPSASAATSLVRGEPGALGAVAKTWLERAAMIGLGIYVLGDRRHVVRNALAGSAAIEAWVIWEAWRQERGPSV